MPEMMMFDSAVEAGCLFAVEQGSEIRCRVANRKVLAAIFLHLYETSQSMPSGDPPSCSDTSLQ